MSSSVVFSLRKTTTYTQLTQADKLVLRIKSLEERVDLLIQHANSLKFPTEIEFIPNDVRMNYAVRDPGSWPEWDTKGELCFPIDSHIPWSRGKFREGHEALVQEMQSEFGF